MSDPEKTAGETPAEAPFAPTPAAEYPVVRNIEVRCPSGAMVLVRSPSAFEMIQRGEITDRILALSERAVRSQETDGEGKPKAKKLNPAERVEIVSFFLAASYIAPRVSVSPKKGHVTLRDIPDSDRQAVIDALGLDDLAG